MALGLPQLLKNLHGLIGIGQFVVLIYMYFYTCRTTKSLVIKRVFSSQNGPKAFALTNPQLD